MDMTMDCPECGRDAAVTYLRAPDGGYLYTCHYTHDGGDNWQWIASPKKEIIATGWAPSGVTADLVSPLENIVRAFPKVWLEHGVIEYQLRLDHPAVFGKHVAERGHHLTGAGQATASSTRLAAGLLRLERLDVLTHKLGPATGGWDYNGQVGYWALTPPPEASAVLTWAARSDELGRLSADWSDKDRAAVQQLASEYQQS